MAAITTTKKVARIHLIVLLKRVKPTKMMTKWWQIPLYETMLGKQFKFVRLKFPHFFWLPFTSVHTFQFSLSLISKIHFVIRLDMASIFVTYMPALSTISMK